MCMMKQFVVTMSRWTNAKWVCTIKIRHVILLLLLGLLGVAGTAQAVTVSAGPATCVSLGGPNQNWSNTNRAQLQDNSYATASVNDHQLSDTLQCTGYGFSIPTSATIDGITVTVWRMANNGSCCTDAQMQLVKAGTIQATDRSTTTYYPTSNTAEAHGGATDLWGTTWTPADINDPNFGAAFAIQKPVTAGGNRTVRVDYIEIAIDYTLLPPTPIAEYRFDETGATGANSALDSSGNGLNGTPNGGVVVGGTGAVCSSYNFNGSNAYVAIPNTALLNPSNVTVMAWVRHNTAAFKAWEAILSKGDSAYRMHLNGGCSINSPTVSSALSFGVNGGCATADADSGIVPAAGAWYHVAGTYDGSTIKIYVNGTLAISGAYASTLGTNTYPLWIGDNSQQTARYWSGDIDEVKIWDTALSAAQIASAYANESAGKNWDGSTRVCPISGPDHLVIQSSGNGLTCAANTLTVVACANVACSTYYVGGVSGTLGATGTSTVNWDGTTGGAIGSGFVIPAGLFSVTKNMQVATAGAVTLGVTIAAPTPTNLTTCNFGTNSPSNNNCVFTSSTAGFIVSNNSASGSAYTIPAQVSGIASPLLYLRALQASSTNPAVCTPAIISQSRAVTMGYACNNPATCQPGNLATINATAIAPGGTSVNLTFDANGSAPFSARYDDVGQITLNASNVFTPFAGATPVTLSGSSNAYVVAPHHFGISSVSGGPLKAGNNFSATVTAYNGLATPTVTNNFGLETPAQSVVMSFTKCQPTGTNSSAGSFSGSVTMPFASGSATSSNLNWSEVGNGDLVATNSNYLSSGLSATGNTGTGGTACNGSGKVGRFIPDHFETAVTGPMTCPAGVICPAGGLLYSGEPFSVSATANITVTAKNGLAIPTTTVNYDGTTNTAPNFAKGLTLTAWDAKGSTTTQNPGPGTPNSFAVALTSFTKGVAAVNTPSYAFNTTPTLPTDIYIRAADTDGVSSLLAVPANSVEGGVKVASGRIRIANASGSELLPLPIFAKVQYYAVGGAWVTSSTDSVTSVIASNVPASSNFQFGNYQKNLSSVSVAGAPVTVTFQNGICNSPNGCFRLTDPSAAMGSVDVTLNAPAYLITPALLARATFGEYHGNKNFIYLRENY
jgi:MSHA biogenesis protein MshQ